MMRILLCKINLILILVIALIICIMARPYITNGLVKNRSLLMNRETTISQNHNTKKLTISPITIKTSVIELFNENGYMSQEEIMEAIYFANSEVILFGQVWLALCLLTKMLSFYISFAYIKGWLIKLSYITCNKTRLDFLHLKSGVKNESSYKYLLTTYTLHSN